MLTAFENASISNKSTESKSSALSTGTVKSTASSVSSTESASVSDSSELDWKPDQGQTRHGIDSKIKLNNQLINQKQSLFKLKDNFSNKAKIKFLLPTYLECQDQ